MKECSSGTVPIGDHHIWPALDDESDLVRHPLVNSASKAFARNLPLRTFSNSYFVHEMVVFIVFVAVMQPSPRILRSYSITSLAYTPDRTYKTGNEQHFDAFRQCFVTKWMMVVQASRRQLLKLSRSFQTQVNFFFVAFLKPWHSMSLCCINQPRRLYIYTHIYLYIIYIYICVCVSLSNKDRSR